MECGCGGLHSGEVHSVKISTENICPSEILVLPTRGRPLLDWRHGDTRRDTRSENYNYVLGVSNSTFPGVSVWGGGKVNLVTVLIYGWGGVGARGWGEGVEWSRIEWSGVEWSGVE